MKRTLRVIAYEFINTATRKSFLIATFILPVISIGFFTLLASWDRAEVSGPSATILEVASELSGSETSSMEAEGFIDQSGIIRSIPASIPEELLRAYPDEQTAIRALEAGDIRAYYIIPPDYLDSGEIVYVEPEYNPLAILSKGKLMQWVIRVNLLDGDARLAGKIENPFNLQVITLEEDSQRDESNMLTMIIPYGIMMMFFSIMLSSSSLFLEGLAAEHNNAMLEVLLTSISEWQLLAGKIAGLGIVGLLQTVLWIGSGYLLLRGSGQVFNLSEVYQLPASILFWGVIYYILAYLMYAGILAGIGSLLPALSETSQFSTLILFPLIIPAMMALNFIRDPNGAIATGLSLFPLSAPIAMLARLAATDKVPAWQPPLAALLIGCATLMTVYFAAQVFRANHLLAGQPFLTKLKSLLGYLWRDAK